jgi:hypothetical protein
VRRAAGRNLKLALRTQLQRHAPLSLAAQWHMPQPMHVSAALLRTRLRAREKKVGGGTWLAPLAAAIVH